MPKKTRKGKSPAAPAEEAVGEAVTIAPRNVAKLTVSITRTLSNGDKVFIAPGIEMECSADALEATQADVTERVNAWAEELLAQYPDVDLDDDDDVDDDDVDDDADDDADDDDDGDELTEDDINGMKAAELKALIKEEELNIDVKGMKVADLREAVIEALSEDEDDDDADDDDADDDDDEDEPFTAKDLKSMDVEALQEIVDDWEYEHPKIKKGAKLAVKKKAYIEHILEIQEEDED